MKIGASHYFTFLLAEKRSIIVKKQVYTKRDIVD